MSSANGDQKSTSVFSISMALHLSFSGSLSMILDEVTNSAGQPGQPGQPAAGVLLPLPAPDSAPSGRTTGTC